MSGGTENVSYLTAPNRAPSHSFCRVSTVLSGSAAPVSLNVWKPAGRSTNENLRPKEAGRASRMRRPAGMTYRTSIVLDRLAARGVVEEAVGESYLAANSVTGNETWQIVSRANMYNWRSNIPIRRALVAAIVVMRMWWCGTTRVPNIFWGSSRIDQFEPIPG